MAMPRKAWTQNRLSVRQKMLKAWSKAKDKHNVPSADYDDLCRWYECEYEEVKGGDKGGSSIAPSTLLTTYLDCKNCPLKDCESITSMWVRRDYDGILRAIALWLTPQEVKRLTLELYGGVFSPEHQYVTVKDLTDAVLSLGGPSWKGTAPESYIRALKEWKV